MSDATFFAGLPPLADFTELHRDEWYRPLPNDWWLAVADLENSTEALRSGRQRDVNVISAAVIAGVVNGARPHQLPFVFGGDGAVLAVPDGYRSAAGSALVAARNMARRQFGMGLRIALIPVRDIRAAGREVVVARFEASGHLAQGLFLGGGLEWADMVLRRPEIGRSYRTLAESHPDKGDFSGLECRWQTFASPAGPSMALIVRPEAGDIDGSRAVLRSVLGRLQETYGKPFPNPVDPDALQLALDPRLLLGEAKVHSDGGSPLGVPAYVARTWMLNRVGSALMRYGIRTEATDWGGYKADFARNADYRRCDDALRLVLSGTDRQHDALLAWLDSRQESGALSYGAHRAARLMTTCLVSDYQQAHIHFLDTADGGFTLAATALKAALEQRTRT